MQNWADIFIGTLIAEVPLLYNSDGIPDLDAIARFSEMLAALPIDGVAIKSEMFTSLNLSHETAGKILEIWRKALPEPLTLIVGIDLSSDSDSEDIATITKNADYILAGIGKSSRKKTGAGSFRKLFADIAKHEIPVIVDFKLDDSDKLPFKPEHILELLEMDEVAGVRLAMHDRQILMQDLITNIRMKFPEKAILSGCDRFYGYSLYRGCHGALTRLGPVLPEIQRELIDAWFMCEMTLFLQLSRMVDILAESIFHQPMDLVAARILAALAHTGMISGENAVDPLNPLLVEFEIEYVTATIDAIGELTDAGF